MRGKKTVKQKSKFPRFFPEMNNVLCAAKNLDELLSNEKVLSQYNLSPEDKLYQNLTLACLVINEVRAIMNVSPTHPDANDYSSFTRGWVRGKLFAIRLTCDLIPPFIAAFPGCNLNYIHNSIYTYLIEATGTGNCSEYTHIAAKNLRKHNALIDAQTYQIVSGDHVFLVLDIAKESNPTDFATWGSNAVVCDAWGGDTFPAYEIPYKLMDHKMVNDNGVWINQLTHFSDEEQGLQPIDLKEDNKRENVNFLRIILLLSVFFLLIKTFEPIRDIENFNTPQM